MRITAEQQALQSAATAAADDDQIHLPAIGSLDYFARPIAIRARHRDLLIRQTDAAGALSSQVENVLAQALHDPFRILTRVRGGADLQHLLGNCRHLHHVQ